MTLPEKGLDVSFSKVKYREIAPRIGLDPAARGNDMKTFHIHRARIPTSLFKEIVADLEMTMKQYGEPIQHENEEARSRFLAPVSDSFLPNAVALTFLSAVQSHNCSFQFDYPQYSRICHTWPSYYQWTG